MSLERPIKLIFKNISKVPQWEITILVKIVGEKWPTLMKVWLNSSPTFFCWYFTSPMRKLVILRTIVWKFRWLNEGISYHIIFTEILINSTFYVITWLLHEDIDIQKIPRFLILYPTSFAPKVRDLLKRILNHEIFGVICCNGLFLLSRLSNSYEIENESIILLTKCPPWGFERATFRTQA